MTSLDKDKLETATLTIAAAIASNPGAWRIDTVHTNIPDQAKWVGFLIARLATSIATEVLTHVSSGHTTRRAIP